MCPVLPAPEDSTSPLPITAPVLVGNDWVDLNLGRWRGRGNSKPFVTRVASAKEARWIEDASGKFHLSTVLGDLEKWIEAESDLRAALIWSAKEAAIKVFQKLSPESPIRFHDFEVTLPRSLDQRRISTSIQVPGREDLISLEWEFYPDGVHALCFYSSDGSVSEVRTRVISNLDPELKSKLLQVSLSEKELESVYSEHSQLVRALAKTCAVEWGLGALQIVREPKHGVSSERPERLPPIAMGENGVRLSELDLSLSHDGPGLAIAWARTDHFPASPIPKT